MSEPTLEEDRRDIEAGVGHAPAQARRMLAEVDRLTAELDKADRRLSEEVRVSESLREKLHKTERMLEAWETEAHLHAPGLGETTCAETRTKPCTCDSSPSPRPCGGAAGLGSGWHCERTGERGTAGGGP